MESYFEIDKIEKNGTNELFISLRKVLEGESVTVILDKASGSSTITSSKKFNDGTIISLNTSTSSAIYCFKGDDETPTSYDGFQFYVTEAELSKIEQFLGAS